MSKKILLAAAVLAMASVTSSAFAAVGDYKEISCNTPYFTENSCKACFEGKPLAVGDEVNGLYDLWLNKNSTEQLIYKQEQTMPKMVAISSGTTFEANPSDPSLFWKFGPQIIWTDSATGSGKQEFMLDAGKSVRFLEGDLGASYKLTATDKGAGQAVGVLVIPINYHDIDADGNEGKKLVHTECVSYTSKAAIVKATPVEVVRPAPITPQITKVKTGPEELILVALALMIAAGFVMMRNKKA